MKAIVTISSKGQLTLPAAVRASLGLKKGDRLEASFDEERRQITITPIAAIEELSARVSSYAKRVEPVTDVSSYYESHRTEDRA